MNAIALTGLRAENPLAFLCALGALSLLHDMDGERPRLSWRQGDGTWVPVLHSEDLAGPDEVVSALVAAHEQRDLTEELGWEKDIMKVPREQLREMLKSQQLGSEAARLLVACLAELPIRRDGDSVSYTPFRLIPRVGRAKFLETALRESREGVDHLQSCLFQEWKYAPDTQSMRWDPGSLVPARALMAEAPTHAKPRGVPGAVLLAVRGLASFPLLTRRRRVSTPGMFDRSRFVWPVWRDPLQLPVIRMVLCMRWLYELYGSEREESNAAAGEQRSKAVEQTVTRARWRRPRHQIESQLYAHGITAVFSAPRVRRGDDDEALGWGVPTVIEAPPPHRKDRSA